MGSVTTGITEQQARRKNLAAGGAKKQKEVPKTRREGHIFKIQYWMYAATEGPNVKWGAPISNGGGRAPLAPRWRDPAEQTSKVMRFPVVNLTPKSLDAIYSVLTHAVNECKCTDNRHISSHLINHCTQKL